MLKYPSYDGGKLPEAKKITLKEEGQVVDIINSLLEQATEQPDTELLQRFITNYERLRYFHTVHIGLSAVEDPNDVVALRDPIKLPDGEELPIVWKIE
jgi:hypothetical protein